MSRPTILAPLHSFAPLLRDGGRLLVVASRSLRALAPTLHPRFQNLTTFQAVGPRGDN
jgi:hypothetical protein